MSVDMGRVLFMGQGKHPVCYYRCMLPAMQLGADWVGVLGEPPRLGYVTGIVKKETQAPKLMTDYDIVVLQQPAGPKWVNLIRKMRERGIKVLYEIDDYLHGIKHVKEHAWRKHYNNTNLSRIEQAMKACDGLIGSTEWITDNYRHFNRNTYLAKNGIDLRRYNLQRPFRHTVNIGWAGGTGHQEGLRNWLGMVHAVMQLRADTAFVSIGLDAATALADHFGDDRAIAVPWAAIEQYPSAMSMMDIALAPAGKGGFFRGKSDLRWLEAGALNIPIIANPEVYPDIQPGVTGFHATNQQEVGEHLLSLIDRPELRNMVGGNARAYVEENRTMEKMAPQWERIFEDILERE